MLYCTLFFCAVFSVDDSSMEQCSRAGSTSSSIRSDDSYLTQQRKSGRISGAILKTLRDYHCRVASHEFARADELVHDGIEAFKGHFEDTDQLLVTADDLRSNLKLIEALFFYQIATKIYLSRSACDTATKLADCAVGITRTIEYLKKYEYENVRTANRYFALQILATIAYIDR